MIEFIKETLTYMNDFQILTGTLVFYFSYAFFIAYKEKNSDFELAHSLIREDFWCSTYYELPHYSDLWEGNALPLYELFLSKGLVRKLYWKEKKGRILIPYDYRTYTSSFDEDLLNNYDVIYSYPNYIDTYLNIKYNLLYYTLRTMDISLWQGENTLSSGLSWYLAPMGKWTPPTPSTNFYAYWTTLAEDSFLFENIFHSFDIYIMWLLSFIIIFFFKNLQLKKFVNGLLYFFK